LRLRKGVLRMLGSRALSVTISTATRFRGRFRLAGDKGISHRLAIFAALAQGESRIHNFSSAADCASTLSCLEALGVRIHREGGEVTVEGRGGDSWTQPTGPLDCGNSGSTLRMMAGALAGRPFASTLTGDESLRRRPVERVAAPLRAMGARASGIDGKPPLTIEGGSLRGITFDLPVASAQVKTAVLLAGLQAEGVTTVRSPAESRDHTERLLPVFGVPVERDGLAVRVRGGARLSGAEVAVAGDASSAAFLVVAALVLPDSEVHIERVLLNPGRLGFVEVLRAMGADIEVKVESSEPEPMGSLVARTSRLRGVDVPPAAVPGLIDEVPALAVAAAHAEGRFTVSGAGELRVKESDRIAALAEGLSRLGARIEERPDGLVIDGGTPLQGAAVRAHEDHRIAMALAVAGLAARGETVIEGAECASVSFPEFYGILADATGHA
jgi:3-phosphoshikimate 1-carboxyvinyltransferase